MNFHRAALKPKLSLSRKRSLFQWFQPFQTFHRFAPFKSFQTFHSFKLFKPPPPFDAAQGRLSSPRRRGRIKKGEVPFVAIGAFKSSSANELRPSRREVPNVRKGVKGFFATTGVFRPNILAG